MIHVHVFVLQNVLLKPEAPCCTFLLNCLTVETLKQVVKRLTGNILFHKLNLSCNIQCHV